MPGLFRWGPKDDMTPDERREAKENAEKQMRAQKQGSASKGDKKGHRSARRPSQSPPAPKGSLGW